jgi:thymidylate synthase (FAD)
MNVKLVSLTRSMVEEKELSAEELIVYIGRVSNPTNQLNTETAPKLIAFLLKQPHWSPFELADMTVEIETSRAIAQQILRHRSFSFQEFSQRYAIVNDFEPVQLRKQAEKNRQSSLEESDPIIREGGDYVQASVAVERHIHKSKILYDKLIESGIAKECARMVLPATAQTTIYMKGSVRSWIHYLAERTKPSTQLEHRQIALKIKDLFDFSFPNVAEAINGIQK